MDSSGATVVVGALSSKVVDGANAGVDTMIGGLAIVSPAGRLGVPDPLNTGVPVVSSRTNAAVSLDPAASQLVVLMQVSPDRNTGAPVVPEMVSLIQVGAERPVVDRMAAELLRVAMARQDVVLGQTTEDNEVSPAGSVSYTHAVGLDFKDNTIGVPVVLEPGMKQTEVLGQTGWERAPAAVLGIDMLAHVDVPAVDNTSGMTE